MAPDDGVSGGAAVGKSWTSRIGEPSAVISSVVAVISNGSSAAIDRECQQSRTSSMA